MQKIKSAVAAAALSLLGLSVHAAAVVDDSELSSVTGQDGVTIGGDLNINIGAFTWTDTDTNGGSVSFNGIHITGMFVQTIDVINGETLVNSTITAMKQYVGTGAKAITEANKLLYDTYDAFGTSTGVPVYDPTDGGADAVQFAFPNAKLDRRLTPTVKIDSIKNGNSNKSYGSLEIKNIDMQGTKMWLWAH
ncbi:DUF6160 family protein [Aquabacterium sp.]|uniref:DUF6160 family protein n=1 Tax=Aquabacterium sp. TaxID=1872578 RepID=UPI002E2FCB97|nr:DUF6160 family protein [Aquabacterium sp.]HEX5311726.1 DUF6160 family protein [Aquabacterium sp.]